MSIHIEPIVFQARAFKKGKHFGDPYKAVMTVLKFDDKGYCSGLHGEFTVQEYCELKKQLAEWGIKQLKWKR